MARLVGPRSPDDGSGVRRTPSTFVEWAMRRTGRFAQGGRLVIDADRVRTVLTAPLVNLRPRPWRCPPMEATRPRSFESAPDRVAPRLTPDTIAALRASLSGTV